MHKRRWQMAVFCGGCAALWLAWMLLYGVPRFHEVRSAWVLLRRAEKDYAHLIGEVRRLPQELARLLDAELAVDEVLASVPSEEEIPEVSRRLADLAAACGLKVLRADLGLETVFGPADRVEARGLSTMPLVLSVEGRYEEIGRFLEQVLNGPIRVECERVEFDRSAEAGTRVEATIWMILYARAGGPGSPSGRETLALADHAEGPRSSPNRKRGETR